MEVGWPGLVAIPRPRAGYRLVDDQLEITRGSQRRLIPAGEVVAVLAEAPKAWRAPQDEAGLWERTRQSTQATIALAVVAWVGFVLVASTLTRDRIPDFTRGWVFLGIAIGGRLFAWGPETKDWTKTRSTW